jgi:winged helix-turn helix protein
METYQKLETTQWAELRNILDNSESTKEEFRRAQAIMLLEQEVVPSAISAITRYSRRHIFLLRQRYMTQGAEAIRDKRQPKPRRLLTKAERAKVVETMGTHLRRDTVIPQWFQASKAAAASDGHAVHC